jgi:hypothetical protein
MTGIDNLPGPVAFIPPIHADVYWYYIGCLVLVLVAFYIHARFFVR